MAHTPPLNASAQAPRALLLGLFLTALATLSLEVLDTRLLSVMAWYHLSFFAVSTAMFGMAAGALRAYLGGERFQGAEAPAQLRLHATWFAVAMPLCHVANLAVRIPSGSKPVAIVALFVSTLLLAIPFYLSGVVVTLALTRCGVRAGLAYSVDLVGAALGTLVVIPMFALANLSSAVFATAVLAGLGAIAFARFEGRGRTRGPVLATLAAAVACAWNLTTETPLTIWYVKDRYLGAEGMVVERWNAHSRVVQLQATLDTPFYWGAGSKTPRYEVHGKQLNIDGDALTVMSRWSGAPEEIAWVRHDVTSVPYHLRKGGHAGVIGVGGGRDVLTALWGESRSVTGVELNGLLLERLQGPERAFAHLADDPRVTLVHDEARSWMTRTTQRFDVLQMSLIDTWASTAAGGFTLSENGLYTLDAWRTFLSRLAPRGIFSVSRWYDPAKVSETTRLLSLGTAAVLERGAREPSRHLILVASGLCSTLLVSNDPFDDEDVRRLRQACDENGFQLLAAPGTTASDPRLAAVLASTSRAELDRAVADPEYDFSPPTDERPFFFNMLRAGAALTGGSNTGTGGVLRGNLQATTTLVILFVISLVLVLVTIVGPLLAHGLPRMPSRAFAAALAWFTVIGLSFMFVQVALMQRFSVYLGHPTYAVVVILASMILAAGAGSFVSDRVDVSPGSRMLARVPVLAMLLLLAVWFLVPRLVTVTIEHGLAVRCLVVVSIVAPSAFLMGFFFPIGMRLVQRIQDAATPWMWGVNGACGVLGAVIAVAISMWGGIGANLLVAAFLYGTLAFVGPALARHRS